MSIRVQLPKYGSRLLKNGPSRIRWKTAFKKLEAIWSISRGRPYHFKFLKDCLTQILLGPFFKSSDHQITKAESHRGSYLIENNSMGA